MPFLLVILGAIIIVAALRNTHGQLASELEADIPAFAPWALAVGGVAALGYVPGLRIASRWLLALVVVVLVVKNYTALFGNFASLASDVQQPGSTAAPSPAAAYAQSPASPPAVTTAELTGGGGTTVAGQLAGNVNAVTGPAVAASGLGTFNPAAYTSPYEAAGEGVTAGYGGVA